MERKRYKVDEVIHSKEQKRRRIKITVDDAMNSYGLRKDQGQPNNNGANNFADQVNIENQSDAEENWQLNEIVETDAIE